MTAGTANSSTADRNRSAVGLRSNICPRLDHLQTLTGPFGLYEHALVERPRIEHGYTTDDNGRALVVLSRMGSEGTELAATYRRFVLAAATPHGFHNRLSPAGQWLDRVGSEDAQGRALWGLAHIAADDDEALRAISGWRCLRTGHPRANAYATLAMCELARRHPTYPRLHHALDTFSLRLPRPTPAHDWVWPEPRLTYDNARIPQALIEAGSLLDDPTMVDDGLDLLDWLVAAETGHRGFSFAPVGGRGPVTSKPAFDQQPIEAWGMADACLSASRIDPRFAAAFNDAVDWFLGRNDTGTIMYVAETGACYDGLTWDGVNLNCGAESTLSALGALAAARTEESA